MSTDTNHSGIPHDQLGSAPRVTLEAIEEHIASEHYFTALEGVIGETFMRGERAGDQPAALGLLTFCVLVLKNGFTVVGQSACASPSNFSQEIGQKVARGDAIRQVWPLMGYDLRNKLYVAEQVGAEDDMLGESLTMLTAHSLGNHEALSKRHAEAILKYISEDCEPEDTDRA